MKRLTVLLSSAFLLSIMAAAGTAQQDPHVGIWILDVASSSYSPGPAPRSQTTVYTQIGRGFRVTSSGISATGQNISREFSYSFDGREHPARGYMPDWDSIKARQVDARTIEYTRFLKGEEVQTVTRSVSADGRTATVRVTGVNAKGQTVNDTVVFNRK
jgi:hypothetical protein